MNNLLKNTLILLVALSVIGGLLWFGFYLYRENSNITTNITKNKEKFSADDSTCECAGLTSPYVQYKSIISVESGTTLALEYSPSSTSTEQYYSIKFINSSTNMDEYLMVDATPKLVVGANNINGSDAQLWKIEEVLSNDTTTTVAATTTANTNTTTPTNQANLSSGKKYYLIPKSATDYVLQHQSGSLNIRAKDKLTGQYWILSTNTYKPDVNIPNDYVNIPQSSTINNNLLNRNTPNNSNEINAANQQKLDNVLQLITNSLQQLNNNVKSGSSTSSFGYSVDNPIKINLTMGGSDVSASNSVEAFTNVSSNNNNNVLNLLDNYENSASSSSNSVDALTELIAKNGGCPAIDLNNYTNKRVGQCNCNLSK